jgi:hypothetical protein
MKFRELLTTTPNPTAVTARLTSGQAAMLQTYATLHHLTIEQAVTRILQERLVRLLAEFGLQETDDPR